MGTQGGESMTFVIGCNEAYMEYAHIFAASAARNMPKARIYAHLINVTDETVAVFKKHNPLIEVHRDNASYGDAKNEGVYAGSMYTIPVMHCLERGDLYVFYFDVDAIIRHPIDSIVSVVGENDVALLHKITVKNAQGEHVRFLSSCIVFRNTPATRAYVARIIELIRPHLFEWFSDQIYLSRVYEEMKNTLSMGMLPLSYVDWSCRPGSLVWTMKGNTKVMKEVYRLERLRYEQALGFFESLSITIKQAFYQVAALIKRTQIRLVTAIAGVRSQTQQ